jgi:hypothetical protein
MANNTAWTLPLEGVNFYLQWCNWDLPLIPPLASSLSICLALVPEKTYFLKRTFPTQSLLIPLPCLGNLHVTSYPVLITVFYSLSLFPRMWLPREQGMGLLIVVSILVPSPSCSYFTPTPLLSFFSLPETWMKDRVLLECQEYRYWKKELQGWDTVGNIWTWMGLCLMYIPQLFREPLGAIWDGSCVTAQSQLHLLLILCGATLTIGRWSLMAPRRVLRHTS